MPIGMRFCRRLAASLTCAALFAGCAAGHGHAPRAKMKFWPDCWSRPNTVFSRPYQAGPEVQETQPEYLPTPADPSGSPYPPHSPRGLYVPSAPAPGSKLGLPVPPPLPPDGDDTAPTPEAAPQVDDLPVPPPAEDMEISYDRRLPRHTGTVPPPPSDEHFVTDEPAPRVAERVDPYDRRRQPVNLELPEPDEDAELPPQGLPDDMEPERAPVESFPQPQLIEPRLQRGPGHTPALDEEPPTLIDPSAHQSATRPRRAIPGPVPRLRDQDPELAFPGHRQMSGERTGGFLSVEPAISRVTIRNCCLTRDIQSGKKANIIQATDLVKGQQLVVQTDVEGLERIQRGRELVSRLTCHVAICDAQNKVLYRTSTHSKTEVTYAADSARHVAERLTIPARFKEGDYRLQLHVQDDIAHQVTVVEMPVTIR